MEFDSMLLTLGVTLGPIFIVLGIIMYVFPPKRINYLYGYRTAKSMKNQKNWDFAQQYSARLMILLGCIYGLMMLFLSIVPMSPSLENIIGSGFLILLIVGLFIKVEFKLSKLDD